MLLFNSTNIAQPYFNNVELNKVVFVNVRYYPGFLPNDPKEYHNIETTVWEKVPEGENRCAFLGGNNWNITTLFGINVDHNIANSLTVNSVCISGNKNLIDNSNDFYPVFKKVKSSSGGMYNVNDEWYTEADYFYAPVQSAGLFENAFSDVNMPGASAPVYLQERLDFSLTRYMSNAFSRCYLLNCSPFVAPNLVSLIGTYYLCYNLTGNPYVPNGVTEMSNAYRKCYRLQGCPILPQNCINADNAYEGCTGLNAIILSYGANYGNLDNSFRNCRGLYGDAYTATSMCNAYENCTNLDGSVRRTCNVISNANGAFYNCANITNIDAMSQEDDYINLPYAFYNCSSISKIDLRIQKALTLSYAFCGCPNIHGNLFLNTNNVYSTSFLGRYNAVGIFAGRNTQQRLNIFVLKDTPWDNYFYKVGKLYSNEESVNWTPILDYTFGGGYADIDNNLYVYNDLEGVSEINHFSFSEINNNMVEFRGLSYGG